MTVRKRKPASGAGPRQPAIAGSAPAKTPTAIEPQWMRHPHLAAAGLILVLAALMHGRLLPLVADTDSLYHMRHTWVYATRGIFDSSLPWAQFSVVRTHAADLWYGFHILTIPLSFFDPLLDGIYWGAFLATVTSLGLIYAAFVALHTRWPLLWTVFVALISSDLMYRLTMMRPHPISLGLVVLLFAYLVKPRSRSTLGAIFAIGALQAWLHLALAWLPIFIAGVVACVRLLHRRLPDFGGIAALAAGVVLGVALRPQPLGALKLAYVQIVKLMVEKQTDLPLLFGIELLPFYAVNYYDQFLPISLLLPLAIGGFALLLRDRRSALAADTSIAMWASLAVAATFLALTFGVARRSHEIFFAFSAIFIALVVSEKRWMTWQPAFARFAVALALPTMVAAVGWNAYRYEQILGGAFHPRRYESTATWLAQNAAPGEIVFHPMWERFSDLFFWNPQNYYINGMDPIFAYAYDPGLHWEAHYLANGAADEATCSAYPCVDEVTMTYDALKHHFRASYIAVEANLTGLRQYLERTPRVTKVFESDNGVTLYKLD